MQWRCVVAPNGLDPEAEAVWAAATQQAAENPAFRRTLANPGVELALLYGDALVVPLAHDVAGN